jgi:L-gulono-1,4-lactone dehydrogenase
MTSHDAHQGAQVPATRGSAGSWRNWAGTVTARPVRMRMPGSAAEVAAEVTKAAADGLPIRMAGSGHSFTPAASTEGVLLHPGGMTAVRSIDPAAGLVTVEAGCPLSALNTALRACGLSLTNMGDIQIQTVAGATQTGTPS